MPFASNMFVERHALAQLLFWSSFYYVFPATSAAMAKDTGWSQWEIAIVFTASFLVWAALSSPMGRMVDSGYGEKVMFFAGLLGVAALAVLSAVPNFGVFIVAMLVLGAVMAATLYDPCFALVIRRYGARAGPEVTKVTMVAGFATLLTFGSAAWLLDFGSWRLALLAFAIAALLAVLVLPDIRTDGTAVGPSRPKASGHAVDGGKVAMVGIGFSTVMFSHAALLFTLPVAYENLHGFKLAAFLPALLGPSQIAGRLVWCVLAKKARIEIVARILFLVMLVPPLLLVGFKPTVALILVVIVLQGAGYGIHTVLRPMIAATLFPAVHLGQALGRIAMIGLFMMAVAPAAAGFVRSSVGLQAMLGLLVAMNFCGLAMVWRLRPPAKAKP